MNAPEILDKLTQKGIQVWAENNKLKIQAPKGILTPELKSELVKNKSEILSVLNATYQVRDDSQTNIESTLNPEIIGRLINGLTSTSNHFIPPVIDPKIMATKLKVVFRPLPKRYKNETIIKFRKQLGQILEDFGVIIESWENATREFSYELNIPLTPWKKTVTVRVVKTGIGAVIDVERRPSWLDKGKIWIAEKLYELYSSQTSKQGQKISASKITQLISWAEDNIKAMEDPTNTQAIVLTDINEILSDPEVPYGQKIPIGINTIVSTFSEIVIGVSQTRLSILNMNLSDSVFSREAVKEFVLNSLIPKIYVPILPLPMSRFEIGRYHPTQSPYAVNLVSLGQKLASTGLLPSGFKIKNVVKRKSLQDIVDWMVRGRTGVSYGFVAYAEPPQYVGPVQITEQEWNQLSPVSGFSKDEIRQNAKNRQYIKLSLGNEWIFKQIPDIWIISSRSGSNKTNLDIEKDILRIGLNGKLSLQVPEGIDLNSTDVKPSYDLYVMLGITLAAALYLPKLIENGAPMVHFHGYPSIQWFQAHEYCVGVNNPSVPCGTYESGVFNFRSIESLVEQADKNTALLGLIEPDHGSNIIAYDVDYLIERLNQGIAQQRIELGGKHFTSLKEARI